jgi:hypothetical protein
MEAFALVDYSEGETSPKSKVQLQSAKPESKSLIWKSDFSFTANYETLEIENSKLGLINLNTHLQTPFNVYLDLSYWSAQNEEGSQKGNPKGIIGFNWIRFGSQQDEAKLDLFAGFKMKGSSELASSRNDKIFGAETTKRFGVMGLGIAYDITLTGVPKRESEMSIGNIQRIAVSGGWMVSNDIQFELEAENFKINPSTNEGRVHALGQTISFSTLSPKLNLTLAPAINLEMGARFRTKKIKLRESFAHTRFYDYHGAYSNSLFAGLNLSL